MPERTKSTEDQGSQTPKGNWASRVFGYHNSIRLGLYTPKNVSKDNILVSSYIYGIDDKPLKKLEEEQKDKTSRS